MEKEIKKLEHSNVDVIVPLPKDEWKAAQKKAFDELAKKVSIKGFRKGHVPAEMLKSKIPTQEVFSKAISDTVQKVFEEVVKEEHFQLFARPSFDIGKISEEEVEFIFHLTLKPEVNVGTYKGLDIARDKVTVDEKEIDDEIAKLVAGSANMVVKDGPAQKGDTVVIDFVGSVDGKEFDGGKAENYSLELGSNSFVPGFEDQLVGHKSEEDVDVHVKFPENYVPELAGKEALFKVKIHEVKEKVLPPLDEKLIEDLKIENVKTIEQLRTYQKTQINGRKAHEAEHKLFDEIVDKIVQDAKVDLSDNILNSEVEGMKENLNNQLAQSGLNYDNYLKMTGKTDEEVVAEMKVAAEKNLKRMLVLEKIAELEAIKVEEEELEFEFAKLADQYHMPLEEVKKILGQDLERFKSQVRSKRIQDYLIAQNEAK